MNPELLRIIESGDIDALKKFLATCPADFDLKKEFDDDGDSPFQLAAIFGHVAMFDLLVEEDSKKGGGFWLMNPNNLGDNCLASAIRHRQFAIIEHLVNKYPKYYENTKVEKLHPLSFAVANGDFLLLEFLIQRCKFDIYHNEPLLYILDAAVFRNKVRMYNHLVRHYGLKPTSNFDGFDQFYFAIWKSAHEMIDNLLADSDEELFKSCRISEPLSAAMQSTKLATVAFLLKRGVCIDWKDKEGQEAIALAITAGRCFVLEKKLLRKEVCADMLTMLVSALKLITVLGENQEFLPQQFEGLLKILGENLNARIFKTGDTALHLAVKNNREKEIFALLKNGADASMRNHDKISSFDLLKLSHANEPLKQGDYLLGLCLLQKIKQLENRLNVQRKLENDPRFEEYRLKAESLSLQFKGDVALSQNKYTSSSTNFQDAGDAKGLDESHKLERKRNCEKFENYRTKEQENEINEFLEQIKILLENMTVDEATEIIFSVGKIFSNPESPLYSPIIAYNFLIKIQDKNDANFCEINSIITDLLLSNKITFANIGLQSEWEAQEIEDIRNEKVESRTQRIETVIFHALRSKNSIHNEILGRFVAEYTLGSNESFSGLKDVRGNDPDSYFALVKEQRELRVQLKKTQEALEKARQELKAEQERFKALAQDPIKMQVGINTMQRIMIGRDRNPGQKEKLRLQRSLSF